MIEQKYEEMLEAFCDFARGEIDAVELDLRFGTDSLNTFANALDPSKVDLPVLTLLVKAFVLLGEKSKWFCRGSTARVHCLLEVIEEFDIQAAEYWTSWASSNSTNPYVPFGTYRRNPISARTISEYRRLASLRASDVASAERQRSEDAKRRTAERADSHAIRISNAQRASNDRAIEVDRLSRLDPIARIEEIAKSRHLPTFFPEEFAHVDPAELVTLSSECRNKLLLRLAKKRKGQWGALRRYLEGI